MNVNESDGSNNEVKTLMMIIMTDIILSITWSF